MTKKTSLLAASALFLALAGATPAFAGAGAITAQPGAQQGQWQRGGDDNRGGRSDGGGQRQGGGDGGGQWQGGGNRGDGGGQRNWQQGQQAQPQGQGGQPNWQGGNRGDGQRNWQGGGQRQGGQAWQGQRRDDNNRNWGRDDGRRYGGQSGGQWRNDNYRRDDRRRAYTAVPYGGYFGRSYGSIATRYYGRNYVYYGSRSWSSWDRPWRVGYALPPRLYCSALPYELAYDLPPPPWGYDYILCGRDILLVNDSRVVVDAILPW
jgi:hypothetical protein